MAATQENPRGQVVGETFAEYVARRGINASALKAARISLLHYSHYLRCPRVETAAMALGTAVHCLALEPGRFDSRYCVCRCNGNTTKGKEEREEARLSGHRVISENDYDHARRMADAVRSHPLAAEYLRDGAAEQTIAWTDEETGVECKGRVDWIGAAVVDLKTTRDIGARRFASQMWDLGLHIQAAMYLDGCEAVSGERRPFVCIAVEKSAPHDVGVWHLSEPMVEMGRTEYRYLIRRVLDAAKSERWPGRYESEQEMVAPAWSGFDDGPGIDFGGEVIE